MLSPATADPLIFSSPFACSFLRDLSNKLMAVASKKEYVGSRIIGAGLIAAVLVWNRHADTIKSFIDLHPAEGLFLYLLLNVLDAVLAPGVTLPLIPVAAHVWGRVIAGLATTAGWTAGR